VQDWRMRLDHGRFVPAPKTIWLVVAVALSTSCSPKSTLASPEAAETATVAPTTSRSTSSPSPSTLPASVAPAASVVTTNAEVVFATDVVTTLTSASTRDLATTRVAPTMRCSAPTTEAHETGEITYIADNRLWAMNGLLADQTCLYDLAAKGVEAAAIKRLAWSPDSTALLLGSDRVARGETITNSGYLPTNTDVNWSGPKGTSLLATTAKGALVKRNSRTGERKDISFLATHETSAYHPAGTAIASIGISTNPDVDGEMTSIFLATNLGQNAQRLVDDRSAAKLSELTFNASGSKFLFLADHSDHTHLHTYDMDGLDLTITYESTQLLSQLVASTVGEGLAVGIGDCAAGQTDVLFTTGSEPLLSIRSQVPELGEGSYTPVGWLPNNRLVVLSRANGCDGPGDLQLVDLVAKTVDPVALQVSAAAVRVVHATPAPLSVRIVLPDEVEA
jgi:hypothetical protein